MDNKAKLSSGVIVSIITTIVLISVAFSVLDGALPTAMVSLHNFTDTMSGYTDVVGTAPAAFFGNLDTYAGWFLVIATLGLVIMLVLGLYRKR